MVATTAIVLSLVCWRTAPRPPVVAQFDAATSCSPAGLIHYRLFRPKCDQGLRKPLLVWLHGHGEAGHNNSDQLAWLELLLGPDAENASDFPAYILALQAPREMPAWYTAGADSSGDPLANVQWVLDEICHRYAIDEDCIYLAGISCGAAACWELARREPHRFAAMVVFATTQIDLESADRFTEIPLWAFQSTGDGFRACATTQQMVRKVRRAGGRAHLTLIDQASHDCWTAGFTKFQAWQWLLRQRKGEPDCVPPGVRPPADIRLSRICVLLACAVVLLTWWGRRRAAARRVTSDPRLLCKNSDPPGDR